MVTEQDTDLSRQWAEQGPWPPPGKWGSVHWTSSHYIITVTEWDTDPSRQWAEQGQWPPPEKWGSAGSGSWRGKRRSRPGDTQHPAAWTPPAVQRWLQAQNTPLSWVPHTGSGLCYTQHMPKHTRNVSVFTTTNTVLAASTKYTTIMSTPPCLGAVLHTTHA